MSKSKSEKRSADDIKEISKKKQKVEEEEVKRILQS